MMTLTITCRIIFLSLKLVKLKQTIVLCFTQNLPNTFEVFNDSNTSLPQKKKKTISILSSLK